jgi:hypothetical protein
VKSKLVDEPLLTWNQLHENTKAALGHKLDGLFGWARTDEVFDSLAVNRQQALLLSLRRLQDRQLWDSVRIITNVYGEGGVGIEFTAWPGLRAKLARREDFTSLLAGHRNNEGGFRERRDGGGPALHVVMVEMAARRWAAHFDLYDPLSSLTDLWRHVYLEGWRHQVPDWRQIGGPIKE